MDEPVTKGLIICIVYEPNPAESRYFRGAEGVRFTAHNSIEIVWHYLGDEDFYSEVVFFDPETETVEINALSDDNGG